MIFRVLLILVKFFSQNYIFIATPININNNVGAEIIRFRTKSQPEK